VATQRGARGSIQVAARYAWQTVCSRAAMHLERGFLVWQWWVLEHPASFGPV